MTLEMLNGINRRRGEIIKKTHEKKQSEKHKKGKKLNEGKTIMINCTGF